MLHNICALQYKYNTAQYMTQNSYDNKYATRRERKQTTQNKHIMARSGGGSWVKEDSRKKRPNRNLRREAVTSVVFCVWCTGCLPCAVFSSFKAPTYTDTREAIFRAQANCILLYSTSVGTNPFADDLFYVAASIGQS